LTRNIGFDNGHYFHHPFRDEAVGKTYMTRMWKADPDSLSFPALNAQPNRKPGGVSTFDYPKRGGYQAIIDSWVTQLGDKIVCNVEVTEKCGYERVVWTAPQKGLRYNSLITVTLGYEGTAPPYTAIYLPGTPPFHRLSFPAAFSTSNAPEGHFSVQGEVSVDPEDMGRMLPSAVLLPAMLEKLVEQMMTANNPVMSDVQIHDNAYPVPIDAPMKPHDANFYPHGRTGSHSYINLDGVVAQSMRLAEELTK
jgi:protoporphyrinogen oxidase